MISYQFDVTCRFANVNDVIYTFDANGNLLSDGTNTYAYDSANRLVSVTNGQSSVTSYTYNGLGDRLSQTVDGVTTNYTLDLNAGLTQVLDDGTNAYIYGNGRIAQSSIVNQQYPSGTMSEISYFLGDALGSVRQMTDETGTVTLARTYDPYGNVTSTGGASSTAYGFTGETTDTCGLVYLRAQNDKKSFIKNGKVPSIP